MSSRDALLGAPTPIEDCVLREVSPNSDHAGAKFFNPSSFQSIMPSKLIFALVFVTCAFAQNKIRSPEGDWKDLTNLVTEPKSTGAVKTVRKSAAESEAEVQKQREKYRQTAISARQYYSSYPQDKNAGQARKIEALSLLRAAAHTDADRGQGAVSVAQSFRDNRSNPTNERFEVAALMERQKFALANSGRFLSSDSLHHEKIAESLQAEFGNTPEVFSFHLGVVNTADFETAGRVARKIVQSSAPTPMKVEAQTSLDRYALVGAKLDRRLRTDSGLEVGLGEVGKTTIIYVWSPEQGVSHFGALATQARTVPKDCRWVYIAVRSKTGPFNVFKNQAPFPGIHFYEPPADWGGLSQLLKIRHTPYVYIIDGTEKLVGYGFVDELKDLMRLVSR